MRGLARISRRQDCNWNLFGLSRVAASVHRMASCLNFQTEGEKGEVGYDLVLISYHVTSACDLHRIYPFTPPVVSGME